MKTLARILLVYLALFLAAFISLCFLERGIPTLRDIFDLLVIAAVFVFYTFLPLLAFILWYDQTPEERKADTDAVNRQMAREAHADAIREARRTGPDAVDIALGVAGGLVLGNVIDNLLD